MDNLMNKMKLAQMAKAKMTAAPQPTKKPQAKGKDMYAGKGGKNC